MAKHNLGFKTNDYTFRPTALSEALQQAGLTTTLHLVREPALSVINGSFERHIHAR